MKKKVYILEPTNEALNTCAEIINRIPCFSLREYSPSRETLEFTIECREQDLPFVERMLAPYV